MIVLDTIVIDPLRKLLFLPDARVFLQTVIKLIFHWIRTHFFREKNPGAKELSKQKVNYNGKERFLFFYGKNLETTFFVNIDNEKENFNSICFSRK
jgi:hypothetical protein